MTTYKIKEMGETVHKGNSIVKTMKEWIKREIEIIEQTKVENECNSGAKKAIKQLHNVELVERDGRKQFNIIVNIIDEFEGHGNNLHHLEYVEVQKS